MATPWKKTIRSFEGVNDFIASELIKDNEAQTATGVDFSTGHITGRTDLSATPGVATAGSASVNSVHYCSGSQWLDPTTDKVGATTDAGEAVEKRWYLDDGFKTYFTRVGKQPLVATPSYQHPLGVSPIVSLGWASSAGGTLSGTYRYAFTYATDEGLESNPNGFDWAHTFPVTTDQTIDFSSIAASPDPRVTKRRIYRTQANGSIFYLRKELNDNSTTTFTDADGSDAVLDFLQPLTWMPGGYAGSGGVYIADHSAAPVLSCLSNTIHSVNDAVGRGGAGIVFGAVGNKAVWSMLGFPDYWPEVNSFDLPEPVEAIISHAGVTFYFLHNGIYQVIADTDSEPRWSRTNALFGVVPGEGRTVVQTPYGIVFKSREGLALFDGSSARVISRDLVSPSTLSALTVNDAAFVDSVYYLFHSTATMVFDMRHGADNLRVSTLSTIVNCATKAAISTAVSAYIHRPALSEVVRVHITDPGTGYTSRPTVTIAAPVSGTTATAVAFMQVNRVKITSGGSGYSSAPDVVFAAPATGGTPAKGYSVVAGGVVVAIVVTAPGSGYSAVPTVTLNGGGGSGYTVAALMSVHSVVVTLSGAGYGSADSTHTPIPAVTFDAVGAGETQPKATAELSPVGYRYAPLAASSTKVWRIGGQYIDVLNVGTGAIEASSTEEYTIQTASTGGDWIKKSNLTSARYNVTPVVVGSTVYIYGSATTVDSRTASLATMETGTGSGTWTQTGAQTPGALCGYAIATDGTDFYMYGGYDSGGTALKKLWKYTVSGGTWTEITATTAAPTGAERGDCTMAYVSDKLYIFGGQNTSGTAQSTVLIYNIGIPGWTTDTTGPGRGFSARVSSGCGAYSGKIYIYGGRSNNGTLATYLSDLWEYTPGGGTTAFSNSMASVIGVPALGRFGYAMSGQRLFIFGGSSQDLLTESQLYSIDVTQISDGSMAYGLYVVKASDSGYIKRVGAGSAQAWTWRSKDFVAPHLGSKLTWTRVRLECAGTITVKVSEDGGAVATVKTITDAVRSTPQRFWLPTGSSQVRGQRLALELVGAAGATVHAVDIEGYFDGEHESTQ